MTPDAFHALALQLAAVRAKPVLDTLRFQVAARTFATLGWPAVGWAVIKLSLTDQARVLRWGAAFAAEPGRRGKQGVTLVRLAAVSEDQLAESLTAAWRLAQGAGQAKDRAAA